MVIYQDDSEIYFRIFKDVGKQTSEEHSFVVPAGSDWYIESYRLSGGSDCEIQMVWDIEGVLQVIDATNSSFSLGGIKSHNKFYVLAGNGIKKLGFRLTVKNTKANFVFIGGYIRLKKIL